MIYRVFMIVSGAFALAACSSSPDWMNLNALNPAPRMDTVRFESEPLGAEAKTSNGQTCRTPCALALPINSPLTVMFTLNGYQPASENLETIVSTTALDEAPGLPQLWPNPVFVELTPAPPQPNLVKKPAPKKKTSGKPAAKPAARPKPAAATAPAPMTAVPVQQQEPAPWLSEPSPQR
jgi:hypothetical protein